MNRRAITVPDLELPGVTLSLSAWLVNVGDLVVEGDRVAELLGGEAIVDLESPATGIVSQKLVGVDEVVQVGQEIAVVTTR